MRPIRLLLIVATIAGVGRAADGEAPRPDDAGNTPTDLGRMIVTMDLPDPDTQREPVHLWVDPDYGVLIEFPIPVLDIEGRGFRILDAGEKDSAAVAGEWVLIPHRVPADAKSVQDIPPPYTVFAAPHIEPSFRVLHVALTNGRVYSFLLETPIRQKAKTDATGKPKPRTSIALTRVRFRFPPQVKASKTAAVSTAKNDGAGSDGGNDSDAPEAQEAAASVRRIETLPEATLRECTPQVELGLIDFQRALIAAPRERAVEMAAQSEVFESQEKTAKPYDYGDFEIRVAWATRDTSSNAIALALWVKNKTTDTIGFEPRDWVVRVGGQLYRTTSTKGGLELRPDESAPVFLVIARDQRTGMPLRLAVTNEFIPSARIAGRASAKPFSSYSVPIH